MTDDKKSPIEKLSVVLEKLMDERLQQRRAVEAAQAVLSETPPAPFDHEAAAQALARAQVADVMSGKSTAEAVAAETERQRKAAEKTFAAHEQRHAKARQQFDDASRLVQALTVQALEVDSAIRREIVAWAAEREEAAAQTLAESAARFMGDYFAYKALTWMRDAENRGERGKQFDFKDENDTSIAVPEAARGLLPGDFHSGTGETIIYRRYELQRLISDRVHGILASQSHGLYPQISASLSVD